MSHLTREHEVKGVGWEEWPQVRELNAQLEALAGVDGGLEGGRQVVGIRQPIGALPPAGAPPPRQAWRELLEEAARHARLLEVGLRDASRGLGRLATLPLEAARLAAWRLRLAPG